MGGECDEFLLKTCGEVKYSSFYGGILPYGGDKVK